MGTVRDHGRAVVQALHSSVLLFCGLDCGMSGAGGRVMYFSFSYNID
jgi:hypothetical protein